MRLNALSAAALCFTARAALAASGPPTPLPPPILSTHETTVAATSTSSAVALADTTGLFQTMYVCNTGSNAAYFAFGGSAAVATTSSNTIAAGQCLPPMWSGGTYIAGLSSSGTTLIVRQYNGLTVPGTNASGMIAGSVSVSGTVATLSIAVTPTATTTTSVPAGTAATVFAAGSMTHGCYIFNRSNEAIYVDPTGTASTTSAGGYLVPAGNPWACPYGFTTGLSVYAPTLTDTISGAAW